MLVQSTVVDETIIGNVGVNDWDRGQRTRRSKTETTQLRQTTLDDYSDGGTDREDVLPEFSMEEELEYQATLRQMLRHDLLNKLTIAQGGLELFERERQDRFLEMAMRNLEACGEIVGKMSTLEKSLTTTELMPIDVAAMAERVIRCHQGRDVELSVEGSGWAMADATLFHVIENLVSNALRHANPSKVTVSIEEVGRKVLLKVADDGIGIPMDVRDKLFQEGFKYGPKGNTGLGLFIVNRIARRYHGRIWLEDNVPHGTVFCMELQSDRCSISS